MFRSIQIVLSFFFFAGNLSASDECFRYIVQTNHSFVQNGRLVQGLGSWHEEEMQVPGNRLCCALPLTVSGSDGVSISMGDVVTISGKPSELGLVLDIFRDGSGQPRIIMLRVTPNGYQVELLPPSQESQKAESQRTALEERLSLLGFNWESTGDFADRNFHIGNG